MDEFMCYVYGYQDVDDGDGHPLPNVEKIIFLKKGTKPLEVGVVEEQQQPLTQCRKYFLLHFIVWYCSFI